MKNFFYFDSLQFGMSLGYNLESNYLEFIKENQEQYEKSVCLTYQGSNDITEWDIASIFVGELTEGMVNFINYLKSTSEDMASGSDVLMVSSHSGCSDYLTKQKVQEYIL